MSDLEQHCEDCRGFLGEPFEQVHVWMDELFGKLGPSHRYVRHHVEGTYEAGRLFGAQASRAALLHVLRDCLHLPRRSDYETNAVDALGLPTSMSVESIIEFKEENIMSLMGRHLGDKQKTDVLVWGWLEDIGEAEQVAKGLTTNYSACITDIQSRWEQAKASIAVQVFESEKSSVRYATDVYTASLEGFAEVKKAIEVKHGSVQFGFVTASALINPLMIIDREFVDFLLAELPTPPSEEAAVSFAFPRQVNVRLQALTDARSATVINRFHQFSLSNVRSEIVDESGIDIRFTVSPIPQLVIVTECEGRFYLTAGMHRAFALAESGYEEVPCFILRSKVAPTVNGPYPAYLPSILMQERPPMLLDAFDSNYTSTVKYRRTNRVLRIAAEDFSIPVE